MRWATREIDAPAAAVWQELVDVERWPRWGPSVVAVKAAPLPMSAATRGRVRTVAGVWVPFRVTDFDDGRSWSWVVAGVPATSHRVEPLGADRCRLGFGTPAWASPYLAVCRVAMRRIERAVTTAGRPDPGG
jgi:hypothetical protein